MCGGDEGLIPSRWMYEFEERGRMMMGRCTLHHFRRWQGELFAELHRLDEVTVRMGGG